MWGWDPPRQTAGRPASAVGLTDAPVLPSRQAMNTRERFHATMHYQARDRVPVMDFSFWDETLVNWHEQGINILLVDFSVRKVGLKQLFGLKWHRQFRTDRGPSDDAACGSSGGWPNWMCNFRRFD